KGVGGVPHPLPPFFGKPPSEMKHTHIIAPGKSRKLDKLGVQNQSFRAILPEKIGVTLVIFCYRNLFYHDKSKQPGQGYYSP
ncbi:MAG: hypothetical protein ACE5GO_03440, partial [Anaerolineales bacterium]